MRDRARAALVDVMATALRPSAIWGDALARCAGLVDVEPARCFGCPLRWRCLRHALVTSVTIGTWGGLIAEDRAELLERNAGDVDNAIVDAATAVLHEPAYRHPARAERATAIAYYSPDLRRLDPDALSPTELAELWDPARRLLARDVIARLDTTIATRFLVVDHGIGTGKPVLWENEVTGGPLDGLARRHTSEEGARFGHELLVRMLATIDPAPVEGDIDAHPTATWCLHCDWLVESSLDHATDCPTRRPVVADETAPDLWTDP